MSPNIQGPVSQARIIQFMPRGVFDDAATQAMGEAFDAACGALHQIGQPEKALEEAIARRIISAARKGERDVVRLCDAGMRGLAGPGYRRAVDGGAAAQQNGQLSHVGGDAPSLTRTIRIGG
jgi:hypothetical protein